eukprot:scaffold11036_cov120-Isochrysis_galbana.AAC.2
MPRLPQPVLPMEVPRLHDDTAAGFAVVNGSTQNWPAREATAIHSLPDARGPLNRAWFSPLSMRCLRPCTPPVRLFSVYSLRVQPSIRQDSWSNITKYEGIRCGSTRATSKYPSSAVCCVGYLTRLSGAQWLWIVETKPGWLGLCHPKC